MHFSLLLIVLLVGVASGDDCCGCWERCFPQELDADSRAFFNVINSLRGLTIAYNIKGSYYMMDGSATNSTTFEYQKRVAALIALTQKINTNCPSNCCNQFITSVYLDYLAYFDWDTECLDKCGAAQSLLNMVHINQSSVNWLGGACFLGNQTDGIPCQVPPRNRMAIAFMNNRIQNDNFLSQTFCTNALYGARVSVKTGTGTNMSPPGYLKPAPISSDSLTQIEFDLAFTQSRYLTVTNLLRCVRDRSCEGPLDPIAREEQEQVSRQSDNNKSKTFIYIVPGNKPQKKTYPEGVQGFMKDAADISKAMDAALNPSLDPSATTVA